MSEKPTQPGSLSRFSLSLKISLIVLVATILSLALVDFLVFISMRSALQESVGKRQLEEATHNMGMIDNLLYERYLDIQGLAEKDSLIRFLTFNEGEEEQISKSLDRLRIVSGPWDVLSLLDANGFVVASTKSGYISENVRTDAKSFLAHQATMGSQVYYSDLISSEQTNNDTIIFAAPLRNNFSSKRPIIGTIMGQFSWPVILEILENINAHALLLNRDGEVIGRNSAYDNIGNSDSNYLEQDKMESVLKNKAKLSEVRTSLTNDFNALVSFVPQLGYLDYAGNGWTLVLEVPTAIAFQFATETALQLVIFLAPLIVLIAGAVLISNLQFVVNPISVLTRVAQDIAAGDTSKRAPVLSGDEIGRLAIAFNNMTSKLKKREDELIENAEKLRELDKLKSEFVSLAAHQLRTPVSVVRWTLAMMLEGDFGRMNSAQKKIMSRTFRTVDDLAKIIGDLLNVSRIESGRLVYNKSKMGMISMVKEIAKLFEGKISAKGLNFELEMMVDEEIWFVGDRGKLMAAIGDILDNSYRYTDVGTVRLTIKKEKENLIIEVEDTGIGIPENQLEKIFEKFTRGKNAMTKQISGSGLGLYLAKNTIESHGGIIKLESKLGQGTKVSITFPNI